MEEEEQKDAKQEGKVDAKAQGQEQEDSNAVDAAVGHEDETLDS